MRLFMVCTLGVIATMSFADEPRLNVLFIISDDLAAKAVGVYGESPCETPNIDRLAARGVRFERAYCQFPVCGASRAAMMSGMYSQQNGIMGNKAKSLGANLGDRPSLPEYFKQQGYYTARFGKIYHMGVPATIAEGGHGDDHVASWTERFSFKGAEHHSTGESETLGNVRIGSKMLVIRTDTDGAEQHDVQAADRAVRSMAEHRDNPFFLAVGFVRPHVPFVAPESHFGLYPARSLELAEEVEGDLDDIPKAGLPIWREGNLGMTEPEKRRKALAGYYASVSFMDAQVGRLLDSLDELKLTDRTIVVFCSDHGWHLGEHTFWQKWSLHEESARIPLVIAAPGIKPAVSQSLVEQIDLYPTLAELAGVDVPEHCSGHSLVPLLRNPESTVRDAAYCTKGREHHLIRTDRWAYMDYGSAGRELYDMHADPKQYTNLAADPAHARTTTKLSRLLKAKLKQIEP